jgi:hypothetical protein
MAGSYSHVVTNKQGKLLNPQNFVGMVDSLGDAYETVEEMYGMIHYLAARVELLSPDNMYQTPTQIVEESRVHYRRGIKMSPGIQAPNKPQEFKDPLLPTGFLNG